MSEKDMTMDMDLWVPWLCRWGSSKASIERVDSSERVITHRKYIRYAERHALFPSTSMTSYSGLSQEFKITHWKPYSMTRNYALKVPARNGLDIPVHRPKLNFVL
jgi:hypothetical protein